MPDLFSKVSELLSNPESAQKIRQIASSLASSEDSSEPSDAVPAEGLPAVSSDNADLTGLFSGLSSSVGGHSREMALLNAVRPYLRSSRAGKIDRAIKAIRVIDMLSNLR